MIVPSQLALKTHTNFGCAANLVRQTTSVVDKCLLPQVAPPIGATYRLTHVMRLGTIIYNDPVQSIIRVQSHKNTKNVPY
jgi:hypothetical protein